MTKDDNEWQIRAEMALAVAMQNRTLITYAELADAARIPAPHRIHKLTEWLETLLEDDHRAPNRCVPPGWCHGTANSCQPPAFL